MTFTNMDYRVEYRVEGDEIVVMDSQSAEVVFNIPADIAPFSITDMSSSEMYEAVRAYFPDELDRRGYMAAEKDQRIARQLAKAPAMRSMILSAAMLLDMNVKVIAKEDDTMMNDSLGVIGTIIDFEGTSDALLMKLDNGATEMVWPNEVAAIVYVTDTEDKRCYTAADVYEEVDLYMVNYEPFRSMANDRLAVAREVLFQYCQSVATWEHIETVLDQISDTDLQAILAGVESRLIVH